MPAIATLTTPSSSVSRRACRRSPRNPGHCEVRVAESASATIDAPSFEALTSMPETNGQAATGVADGKLAAAAWLPDDRDT